MYGKPVAGCDYAAVAVEGSVESEPYFACISDTTKPVGTAKLRKAAPFPASRSVEQPGGEYSLVSSGPFSSHVQTDNGVYHVVLQSRGLDPLTAEGSHSLIASVNVSSGAVNTVQHTVAEADWDKGLPKSQRLWRWPVVAIAGGLQGALDVLMARRGGVEASPVTMDALGRRYDLYWAQQPLEPASGLVNKTAPLKKTYEVPDHKAGVPDAPDMAALGFAWHVTQGPNTMLVAPLIPNDDTLAIDLVSIGEGKGTKTWTMYDDTAPDPCMYPRWMVAAGSS